MQSIWIFPLAQPAPASLIPALEHTLADWKAHGTPVPSRTQLVASHFVVVEALDEHSGCSIDWMTRALQQVLQAHGLQLLEQGLVFYDHHGTLAYCHHSQLDSLIADGTLAADTTVYDTSCVHRGSLQGFVAPLSATWLRRYLPANVG